LYKEVYHTKPAKSRKKLSDDTASGIEYLKHCKEQNIPLLNVVRFTDFVLSGPGKSAPAKYMFSAMRNV
jgi:hypothetical protein